MTRGPYRLAVFDFDGTLADSRRGIVLAVEAALARHGVASPGDPAIAALIGLPLDVFFSRLAPPGSDAALVAALSDAYREAYPPLARETTRLYDGVADALLRLSERGVRMAIATSKSFRGATAAALNLGIARHFEIIVAADTVAMPKPHPESVERALAFFGVGASEALVIGDTTYDVDMGRRAGVDTCAVTWGVHAREALERETPTWIVSAPSGIAPIFE
jgi:phosphoglycolate phosphatase